MGDFDEEMEVVGEDAEGEDADAAEAFVFAEVFEEEIAGGGIEMELAVHDAGDAVVIGGAFGGGDLEARQAHGTDDGGKEGIGAIK